VGLKEISTSILILLGAGVMFLSLLGTRKVLLLVKGSKYIRHWRILLYLMIFFLIGYLASLTLVLAGQIEILAILAGVIFLFGASFVYLVVRTGYLTIEESQEQARTLDFLSREKDDLLAELQAREDSQQHLVEMVRELASPVIPLAEGVIAMPLIGAIDSQRADYVTDALLEGVSAHRAAVAIIDITGVPVVDTVVASALIEAMAGVRLLGAQTVLTGIRAEVAQTMVTLGLDLKDITTRATLQEGLEYAIVWPEEGEAETRE
jgi:anti-anti-sigma regulatory factor